ncbi:MAG: hypothetical protein FWD92_00005 [Methanomassiliicoccaceae archaeon]|nr:hypothetical protein [Methanomassiliicoccaceae archaeon]
MITNSKQKAFFAVFAAVILTAAVFVPHLDSDTDSDISFSLDTIGAQTPPPGAIPISSAADLAMIGSTGAAAGAWPMNAYYYLTQDIVMSGEWTPIGSSTTPFSGTLDGQGHTISGLTINGGVGGLFGNTSGSTVTSIFLSIEMVVTNNSGGVISSANNTHISHTHVYGTISNSLLISTHSVGGLVGISSNVTIENSSFSGTLHAQRVGGAIGSANLSYSISEFSNTGNISNTYNGGIIGGIIGLTSNGSSGTISKSSNLGKINSALSSDVGGIIGRALGNNILIIDSFNQGDITSDGTRLGASSNLGGIIGSGNSSSPIIVDRVFNAGSISSDGFGNAGGLFGNTRVTTIINSFNIGPVSTGIEVALAGGLVGDAVERVHIINSYSAAPITGASGAIAGLFDTTSSIVNTFAIADSLFYPDGTHRPDRIAVAGLPNIDGISNPGRLPHQASGIFSMESMTPSLSDAQYGKSIYFTGTTHTDYGIIPGWDFVSIWTIDPDINGGLPVLRHSLDMPPELPSFSVHTVNISAYPGEEIIFVPILTHGATVTAINLPVGLYWYDGLLFGHVTASGEHTIVLTAQWIIGGLTVSDVQIIVISISDSQDTSNLAFILFLFAGALIIIGFIIAMKNFKLGLCIAGAGMALILAIIGGISYE